MTPKRRCFRIESVSGTRPYFDRVFFDGGWRSCRYRKCEQRGCHKEPAYVVIKTVSCLYPRRRDGARSRGLHEWLSPRRLCEEHARSYCAKWDIHMGEEVRGQKCSCPWSDCSVSTPLTRHQNDADRINQSLECITQGASDSVGRLASETKEGRQPSVSISRRVPTVGTGQMGPHQNWPTLNRVGDSRDACSCAIQEDESPLADREKSATDYPKKREPEDAARKEASGMGEVTGVRGGEKLGCPDRPGARSSGEVGTAHILDRFDLAAAYFGFAARAGRTAP